MCTLPTLVTEFKGISRSAAHGIMKNGISWAPQPVAMELLITAPNL